MGAAWGSPLLKRSPACTAQLLKSARERTAGAVVSPWPSTRTPRKAADETHSLRERNGYCYPGLSKVRAVLRSIILRFVLPLALASAVVAYFAMPHIDQMLAEWFRGDIELRASLVEGSMEERLADLVSRHDKAGVRKYLSRVATDQRISAILVCDSDGTLFYRTAPTPDEVSCQLSAAPNPGTSQIIRMSSGAMHVAGFQIARPDKPAFTVFVAHDLG